MEINTNIQCKKFDLKKLIHLILTQYYNYDNITLNVYYNNKICDKFSTNDIKIDALLDKTPIPQAYTLILRENSDIKKIICHEMVHLDQYERGDLVLIKDENGLKFQWKNKDFDPSMPYKKRPWEKEALGLETKIWKMFKKCV